MTVIAFRPRPRASRPGTAAAPVALTGTFRSPRGRTGRMVGSLRVRRLVVVPSGTFVTGVFTGELRDDDGSLIGVDTHRATIAADVVDRADGRVTVLRPFQLDLMGIPVDVDATTVGAVLAPIRSLVPRLTARRGWVPPEGVPS